MKCNVPNKYAVPTQLYPLCPPISWMIVGSATAAIVWSIAARNAGKAVSLRYWSATLLLTSKHKPFKMSVNLSYIPQVGDRRTLEIWFLNCWHDVSLRIKGKKHRAHFGGSVWTSSAFHVCPGLWEWWSLYESEVWSVPVMPFLTGSRANFTSSSSSTTILQLGLSSSGWTPPMLLMSSQLQTFLPMSLYKSNSAYERI